MTSSIGGAARAAAVLFLVGIAAAGPATAQRAQDATPMPAAGPASQTVEPAVVPAPETSGPRVRQDLRRVEPAVVGRATEAPALMKKDNMNTITISTLALVLAVIIIVLLVR